MIILRANIANERNLNLVSAKSLSVLGVHLHFVSIANFCKKSIITRKRTIFEGSFSLHYS